MYVRAHREWSKSGFVDIHKNKKQRRSCGGGGEENACFGTAPPVLRYSVTCVGEEVGR